MNAKLSATLSVIAALMMLMVPLAVVMTDNASVSADPAAADDVSAPAASQFGNILNLLEKYAAPVALSYLDSKGIDYQTVIDSGLAAMGILSTLSTGEAVAISEPVPIDGTVTIEDGDSYSIGDGNVYTFSKDSMIIFAEGATLILGDDFVINASGTVIELDEGSMIQIDSDTIIPVPAEMYISVNGSVTSNCDYSIIKSETGLKITVDQYFKVSGSMEVSNAMQNDESTVVLKITGNNGDAKEIVTKANIDVTVDIAKGTFTVAGNAKLDVNIPEISCNAEGTTVAIKDIKAAINADITSDKSIVVKLDGNSSCKVASETIIDGGKITIEGDANSKTKGDFTINNIDPETYSVDFKDIKGTIDSESSTSIKAVSPYATVVVEKMNYKASLKINDNDKDAINLSASASLDKFEITAEDFKATAKDVGYNLTLNVGKFIDAQGEFEIPTADLSYTTKATVDITSEKDGPKGTVSASQSLNASVKYDDKDQPVVSIELSSGIDNFDVSVPLKDYEFTEKYSASNVKLNAKTTFTVNDEFTIPTVYATESADRIEIYHGIPESGTVQSAKISNFEIATSNEGQETPEDWRTVIIENAAVKIGSFDYEQTGATNIKSNGKDISVTVADIETRSVNIEAKNLSVEAVSASSDKTSFSMSDATVIIDMEGIGIDLNKGNFDINGLGFPFMLRIGADAKVKANDLIVYSSVNVVDPKSVSGNILLSATYDEEDEDCAIAYIGDGIVEFDGVTDVPMDYNESRYGAPACLSIEFGNEVKAKMVTSPYFNLLPLTAEQKAEGYGDYNAQTGEIADLYDDFVVNVDAKKYKLSYGNFSQDVKAFEHIELSVPEKADFYGYYDGEFVCYDDYLMKPRDVTLVELYSSEPAYISGIVDGSSSDVVIMSEEAIAKAQEAGKLTIKTKGGTFVFDAVAIETLGEWSFPIQVSTVTDVEYTNAVGNGTVYSIESGVDTFGDGTVLVTVNYKLNNQKADDLMVFYLDTFGNLTEITDYTVGEAVDGVVPVTMTLEHFSNYVIKTVELPDQGSGSNNNTMLFVIIGVIAAIVVIAAAVFILKKKA